MAMSPSPKSGSAEASDAVPPAAPRGRRTGARPVGRRQAPADSRGRRIGILIVAYNAVGTLAQVLRRIPRPVWDNVEEVVVFDDASQDATYELAVGYKVLSELAKLRIFKHNRNLGYGGNQKAGYNYFLRKGFDVVVLLHGDGQYAPEILADLYHPIVAGQADAVFGSRMLPDYGGPLKGGMPLYKYVGNRVLTFIENRALGMNLSEFHSGYRAYSLHALRQIDLSRMTDDFHFDTEIIIKLRHQNFRILEVPIPTYYGSEICYVKGLKYAYDVLRAVYRYRSTVRAVKCFPEFQEYFVRYPLKESRNSSHWHLLRLAGAGQDILECGCGDGRLTRKLHAQGNRVVGLDVQAEPAEVSAFQAYIRADLAQGLRQAWEQLGERKFDTVLLADVLEHLPEPEQLLRDCRQVLKANGRIVVSLPNVAHFWVRLQLLFGRFEYGERGILDRGHLRFYTKKSARRLLEQSGYRIVKQLSTIVPLELATGLSPDNIPLRWLNGVSAWLTRLMPGLFAYQHMFVAVPEGDPPA